MVARMRYVLFPASLVTILIGVNSIIPKNQFDNF